MGLTQAEKDFSVQELEQLSVVSEADFVARDHRLCDCPLTYVHRKHHAALGVGIEIRLCCLAKKVEELAGLPPGTFFLALEFEPTWEWDCEKLAKRTRRSPDGTETVEFVKVGIPPRWLRERMEAKCIPIHNLPKE